MTKRFIAEYKYVVKLYRPLASGKVRILYWTGRRWVRDYEKAKDFLVGSAALDERRRLYKVTPRRGYILSGVDERRYPYHGPWPPEQPPEQQPPPM